jgi:hypothetical protein
MEAHMTESKRPDEPQPDETAADPPAAVQWMMQQAAAGQSAAMLPPSTGDAPVLGLAAMPAEAALAARRQRVAEALRGNPRLTEGLPDDAAEALMALGLEMARKVVDDTADLDDAAAEDILQPRVRAVRRFMMAAAEAVTAITTDDVSGWTRQASIALGDHFSPPDNAAEKALAAAWRDAVGRSATRIATLRRFIADHTDR